MNANGGEAHGALATKNGATRAPTAVTIVPGHRTVHFDVTVMDEGVYNLFDKESPEDREELARCVITTGAQILRYSGAIVGADYVDRRFEAVAHQVDTLVRQARDELTAAITEQFDPTKSDSYTAHLGTLGPQIEQRMSQSLSDILGAALSLDNDSAPLARIKREMDRQIGEIREQLQTQATTRKVIDGTTLKGALFEAKLEDALSTMLGSGDTLDDVRHRPGRLRGRQHGKKGDYVIDVQDNASMRIVIESKDEAGMTSKKACETLNLAMRNREARFGVLVLASRELLPGECKCWQLYDDDKVVCSFDEDGLCLQIALRYARGRLLMWCAESDGVDVTGIRQQLERARRAMQKLDSARRAAEGVEENAGKVARLVHSAEADLAEALDAIEQSL